MLSHALYAAIQVRSSNSVQAELIFASSQVHAIHRVTSLRHEVHNRFDCKVFYWFIRGIHSCSECSICSCICDFKFPYLVHCPSSLGSVCRCRCCIRCNREYPYCWLPRVVRQAQGCSSTGGTGERLPAPLDPLLISPCRQHFPDVALLQGVSTRSVVELSAVSFIEQEEVGSKGGNSWVVHTTSSCIVDIIPNTIYILHNACYTSATILAKYHKLLQSSRFAMKLRPDRKVTPSRVGS